MTHQELNNYIQHRNIYMNFKIESDGTVWGLPEGTKSQPLLSNSQFEEYGNFLTNAIELLEKLEGSSMADSKALKKFKLYLKRYNSAKSKSDAITAVEVDPIEDTLNKMIHEGLELTIDGEVLSFDKGLECFIDSEFTYSKGEVYDILRDHENGINTGLKQYNDFEEHGFRN